MKGDVSKMSGINKVYYVGGLGGFMGADGINPIGFEIWVGNADRQWLEVHYVKKGIRPLGKMKSFIPNGPDHPDSLLDACIAFFPEHFRSCPSLAKVREEIKDTERIDFSEGIDVPPSWSKLREEARPLFKKLHIFKADLKEMTL